MSLGFFVVAPTDFNGGWSTYTDCKTFSDKWNLYFKRGLSNDLGVKGYIKQILF